MDGFGLASAASAYMLSPDANVVALPTQPSASVARKRPESESGRMLRRVDEPAYGECSGERQDGGTDQQRLLGSGVEARWRCEPIAGNGPREVCHRVHDRRDRTGASESPWRRARSRLHPAKPQQLCPPDTRIEDERGQEGHRLDDEPAVDDGVHPAVQAVVRRRGGSADDRLGRDAQRQAERDRGEQAGAHPYRDQHDRRREPQSAPVTEREREHHRDELHRERRGIAHAVSVVMQ